MIRIAAALLFVGIGISPSQAASDCLIHGLTLIPGVEVSGFMYVKTGKRCGIQSGNSFGGTTGVQIRQRPSHGNLQVNGLGLTYTPRAGFVGKDSFSYLRHGLDASNNARIVFPVNVEVIVER